MPRGLIWGAPLLEQGPQGLPRSWPGRRARWGPTGSTSAFDLIGGVRGLCVRCPVRGAQYMWAQCEFVGHMMLQVLRSPP